ncbi:MAG: hypothetical protein EU541_01170 [Promethearchaeota archaeon]|nr:MAG: hypothetical protein EU541_01170 [Candidatus Lokiarchaeota archaeon]
MEVLELKPLKKRVKAYVFKKSRHEFPGDIKALSQFLKDKNIKFITFDFDFNMKEFSKTEFAHLLNDMGISYHQVDIPEYAMGYIYEDILEKEELFKELVEEYQSMEDKDSYKGLSLKNWIDMLRDEIQEKEINLSLKIRPQWIAKKMLDICRTYNEEEMAFMHFVQEDICEDICSELTKILRNLNVRVIQYTKKHNVKHIVF